MENGNLIKKLPFGPRGIYIIRSSEYCQKRRGKKKENNKKKKSERKKKEKFLFLNTVLGLIGSKFIRLGNGTV